MKENANETTQIPVDTKRSRRRVATGKVTNCKRLNVRNSPDANGVVIGVISNNDRVKVHFEESVGEYYRILEPIYGFAKKEFIEVK